MLVTLKVDSIEISNHNWVYLICYTLPSGILSWKK